MFYLKKARKMFSIILVILMISTDGLVCSSMVKNGNTTNNNNKHQTLTIKMPDIRPDHAEQYLCMAHRVPADSLGHYIVGFNPDSSASRVHHMLMYGCEEPGIYQRDSPNFVWDCSEMHSVASKANNNNNDESINTYEQGPICRRNHKIMYGWAMDAPALKLPTGVGFKIGGFDTKINFLVLQVHYGHIHAFQSNPQLTDNSGLILDLKRNDQSSGINKQAGVLISMSLGQVAMGKSKHEIWCPIEENIEIHPFRFRVHTHKLGTKVMGAKISGKENLIKQQVPSSEAQLIGEEDPQKPQMFYPVKEKDLVLRKGDSVYARCEFNNNKTHTVNIGQTGDDEMCNFYIMYWTKSPKLLSKDSCYQYNQQSRFGFW